MSIWFIFYWPIIIKCWDIAASLKWGSCLPSVREWGRCYDKTRKISPIACFYQTIHLTILYPVKEQQGNKIFNWMNYITTLSNLCFRNKYHFLLVLHCEPSYYEHPRFDSQRGLGMRQLSLRKITDALWYITYLG